MSNQSLSRQDLLQLAAEYADFCVLVTTADLQLPGPQVLYVNSAWTRMTGYSLADIVGKTPRILQGPETDKKMLVRLKNALDTGKDFIARTTNYKQNGEPFELEWVITHLKNTDGETTHYIALQRDITGVSRAEDELEIFDSELRDAKAQLLDKTEQLKAVEGALVEKAKFAALGEVAAGVVHDLSNALTPVFGVLELLHSMDSLPQEAKALTSDLDVTIEHAMNLLANLRHYHSSGGEQSKEQVDLVQLIHRLPDLTKGKWADANRVATAGIDFAFDIQNHAVVEGQDVELLQVLVNLVLNAIDAMPDGGTITISMALTDNNQVQLMVSDTGVGMTEELAKTCFEPYVKGRSSGTGLGLSVCKRIIESHGGSIRAIPFSNHGVTFSIQLPVAPAAVVEPAIPGNVD